MIDRIRCRLNRGGSHVAALAALSLAALPALFAQATTPPPAPPVFPQMKLQIGGTYLGVGVADILTPERAKELNLKEPQGVEITSVEEDSPAGRAGLRKNDVVLDYNGTRVDGIEQFIRLVRETPSGRVVKMTVSRGGATQTLTATIETRKARNVYRGAFPGVEPPNVNVWIPDIPRAFTSWRSSMLGIEAEGLDGQLAQYFGVKEGVLVRSVSKDSPAEKAGLKAGDVILKADGDDITSPRELSTALRTQQRNKQTLPLTIMRERRESTVTVTLEQERSRMNTPSRKVIIQRDDQF
jgi:serine protease Do